MSHDAPDSSVLDSINQDAPPSATPVPASSLLPGTAAAGLCCSAQFILWTSFARMRYLGAEP